MINHIYRILCVEPCLYLWNKVTLIIVDGMLDINVYSFLWYFIMFSALFYHQLRFTPCACICAHKWIYACACVLIGFKLILAIYSKGEILYILWCKICQQSFVVILLWRTFGKIDVRILPTDFDHSWISFHSHQPGPSTALSLHQRQNL